MNTLPEALAQHARSRAEQTAICAGNRSLSYAELWQNICHTAQLLSKQVPAGACIILPAEKRAEMIVCYFAAHLAGVTNVLIDPKLNKTRLAELRETVQPVLSIGLTQPEPGLRNLPWPQLIPAEHSLSLPALPPADTVADLMFTTGTTGEPKGVPLTHGNIAAAAANINSFIGNRPGDTEVIALPLCHSFGMGRLRCQLLAGGTAVILPNFGNERKLLRQLEERKAEGFAFVPAAWQYLKKLCGERLRDAARHLRYIEIGSAALPLEDKKLLMTWFPETRICMHYGLTEASRSTFIEFHRDADHLDSVGKASPNVELAILSEAGEAMPTGQAGEICIRGQHVMQRYRQDLADSHHGSYFRSGDIGYLDTEGYLHLEGRIRELINSGGKKIAPAEIEHMLELHPAVRECACTAAADPDGVLGEVVKAHIVYEANSPRPTQADLLQFLQGKLESYKMPRLFAEVQQLPRTESGKLQRQLLR